MWPPYKPGNLENLVDWIFAFNQLVSFAKILLTLFQLDWLKFVICIGLLWTGGGVCYWALGICVGMTHAHTIAGDSVLGLLVVHHCNIRIIVPNASRISGQMLKTYRNRPEILDTYAGHFKFFSMRLGKDQIGSKFAMSRINAYLGPNVQKKGDLNVHNKSRNLGQKRGWWGHWLGNQNYQH